MARAAAARRLPLLLCALAGLCWPGARAQDADEQMERYAPKDCKYNMVPHTLTSRAFTTATGEAHVNDVFGLQKTTRRHVIEVTASGSSLLTLQSETHRDTPATIAVDVYRRGFKEGAVGRIFSGEQMVGSGGMDTKIFLHGLISDTNLVFDIVLVVTTVELAKTQQDAKVENSGCWPLRLDISLIPTSRARLHWPAKCPGDSRDNLPSAMKPGSDVVVLQDEPFKLQPEKGLKHFSFQWGEDRPFVGFKQAIWDAIIEVPPKLHRFVRLFFRTSFRFASGPLQIVLELFDMQDTVDETAVEPKCLLGCLGGVPVYNGQLFDHAMPTGFKYRIWLLRAQLDEWSSVVPAGQRCLEFDFDYEVKFESGVTPFEVGPTAWLCQGTRLPVKIVQTKDNSAWKEHVEGELVVGRTIWVRDHFVFPPDEITDMEHVIDIQVSEKSIFRATTHEADGVDVFMALTKKDGGSDRICKAVKHPGPVSRQTIFCHLEPGSYQLTVFADFPLGGLHPCGDFHAQIALRPIELSQTAEMKRCAANPSDMRTLGVSTTSEVGKPAWKSINVPIKFGDKAGTVVVWRTLVQVTKEQESRRAHLRLVAHSDYTSADLRFQVRHGGKAVADNQLTANGYADMLGPLDAGAYDLELYYISGTGAPKGTLLCGSASLDMRLVLPLDTPETVANVGSWLCSSIRVPLPETIAPNSDETTLIDSEYEIPAEGKHTFTLKLSERRLVRVLALSETHIFHIHGYRNREVKSLVTGQDNIQVALEPGTYTIKLVSSKKATVGGSGCRIFNLNMLAQNEAGLHQCPWSSGSSVADEFAADAGQKEVDDYIGQLTLNLDPQAVSKEIKRAPTKTFWMNPGMEKHFDLNFESNVAVRFEITVQPPILPIEIVLHRVGSNHKMEGAFAVASFTESRLLLMHSDVPRGKYKLSFMQAEKYTLMDGRQLADIESYCAHASIVAEVGLASKESINSLRSEMLDIPDLLAVQPLPASVNEVGWLGSSASTMVGTQVYRFIDGVGKSSLTLDNNAIIRLVSEPADLSNSAIDVRLMQGSTVVSQSDNLGQMVVEAAKGTYELEMRPHVHTSPFIVTFGIASVDQLKQDAALHDTSACLDKVPSLAPPAGWSPGGWSIGPVTVRLTPSSSGTLATIPVTISAPSVLYMEIGSELPTDLIRAAIKVPEGLWIGEQRGLRNSLGIELVNGIYRIQLDQPLPPPASVTFRKCLEFSVYLVATPLNADSAAQSSGIVSKPDAAGGAKQSTVREQEAEEASSCFSSGTLPLPLDLTDPKGGSAALGGPIDDNGRLLVRGRVLITDMHDGRKKTYLSVNGKKSQMKIGISLGGYSRFSSVNSVSFAVIDTTTKKEIPPTETWSIIDGWERVYILDGSGYWLSFHHPHRERSATACLHFTLQLEVHPIDDVPRMSHCTNGGTEPSTLLPQTLDLSDSQSNKQIFLMSKSHLFLRQQQIGFLTRTRFTLSVTSWVYAEVGYNFFISHAEMDIIKAVGSTEALVVPHLDFIHGRGHELNARLLLGESLPPGDYILRVADDHWGSQVGHGSEGCFPFSLDVTIVPEGAPPTVVSVLPHPSVIVPRGADLAVTLRFSEPPRGTVEQVIGMISLGGVRAALGGSINEFAGQYVQRKTNVKASVEEGHRVWIITFLADMLDQLPETAKLDIGNLVSNVSLKKFSFSAPTYSFGGDVSKPPWSGSGSAAAVPAPRDTSRGVGAPGLETGNAEPKAEAGVGEMRLEGGGAAMSPSISEHNVVGRVNFGDSGIGSTGVIKDEPLLPQVEEWNPMVAPSSSSTLAPGSDGCPPGSSLSPQSGICEIGGSPWPTGYRVVVLGCAASLVMFYYLYGRGVKSHGASARFKDIGHRTAEEELGLVQSVDVDDDML